MINDLKCWYNSKIVFLKDVHVSVLDFGFIHSHATYDVFRIKDTKPRFMDLHVERFNQSCRYFGFSPIQNIPQRAEELLHINKLSDAFVWLCAWSGTPHSGSPRDINCPQHSLIYVKPYYGLVKTNNFTLCINRRYRRVPDLCYEQKYKNFGWIEFNLAQKEAVSAGYDSALLLDPSGGVTEGPGFGICFVDNGKVVTPKDNCLRSVTISVVERICNTNGIPFERRFIAEKEVPLFDEVFACSTSGGITPVSHIDSTVYTDIITRKIMTLFDQEC